MKMILDLYRPTAEQTKALRDKGYYVYHTRYWDSGVGETLNNHIVIVNYGQTVVCDEEPKWEESYTDVNCFEEKWINNFDKYIDDNNVETFFLEEEDDDEFLNNVKEIMNEN